MADKEPPKVVPPRNNLKKMPVFVKATIRDLEGAQPGFKMQWCHATDPKHPNYYERYLQPQRVGDMEVGFADCDPWEFVPAKEVVGRPREDQGSPIDSAMRHGELVAMRVPEEMHDATYGEYDRLRDKARSARLRNGDAERVNTDNGGSATYKARVQDFGGSPRELLNQPQGA